jgi:hypothetical protein
MKTSCFTTIIAAFLLFCSNVIQAQNVTPKLNQLKLMEDLWVGNLQYDFSSKDSLSVGETQQYGNAFEYKIFLVVNGKKSFQFGGSYVYLPKEDRFKGFGYFSNGSYQTWIGSFTTETKFCIDIVQNFNPEKVLSREVVEWQNPTNYTATFYNLDGTKRSGPFKWIRTK